MPQWRNWQPQALWKRPAISPCGIEPRLGHLHFMQNAFERNGYFTLFPLTLYYALRILIIVG